MVSRRGSTEIKVAIQTCLMQVSLPGSCIQVLMVSLWKSSCFFCFLYSDATVRLFEIRAGISVVVEILVVEQPADTVLEGVFKVCSVMREIRVIFVLGI